MRAVVFQGFGQPPTVDVVPDPAPPPDGVLIAVRATGICRSDWHGWMGHDAEIALPHVPGHEFSGVIAALGKDVRNHRIGERVTVPFVCACGRCEQCAAGDHQVCLDQYQPGFSGWGSYAEFVAVPHADLNLVPLPDSMDFVDAAALGCRFSTAYRAVTVHGRVEPGQWLAVHGCGGVGLAAIMIARAAGARVVAVDVSTAALALASTLGAEVVIRAGDDVGPMVRQATGGGAHVSIDAFGSPATCFNSILSLRPRGRHVQVGLLPSEDGLSAVPMAAVIGREIEVIGSHGMSARAFAPMLADIAAGRLAPGHLIGARITLDEAPAALIAMSAPAGPAGTSVVEIPS